MNVDGQTAQRTIICTCVHDLEINAQVNKLCSNCWRLRRVDVWAGVNGWGMKHCWTDKWVMKRWPIGCLVGKIIEVLHRCVDHET